MCLDTVLERYESFVFQILFIFLVVVVVIWEAVALLPDDRCVGRCH